ncbi:hypothetical protein [Anaerosinus massiliensis]|uniref:hypothetical protein n=1 Tax=Massilibacillus massiliensis TaxID=1806837 RepID=UPI000DA5ED9C|nr:hypothetical protein [Massilibacillus massiliensis]
MAELKDRISNHVKAAKAWLGRAEESFDKEEDIRGELNLMLAQAELKRAQESKERNKKYRRKNRLIHSMLAASVAGLVAVVGFSGLGMIDRKPAVEAIVQFNELEQPKAVIVDKTEKPLLDDKPKQRTEKKLESTVASPVIKREISEVNPIQETNVHVEEKIHQTSTLKEESIDLPPAQMQTLMRAAGKSLRGQ